MSSKGKAAINQAGKVWLLLGFPPNEDVIHSFGKYIVVQVLLNTY